MANKGRRPKKSINEYIEKKISMRKLWDLVKQTGVVVKDYLDRNELEKVLKENSYEPKYELEEIEDYWTFESRKVGSGYIIAKDIIGNYSAFVYPDGTCKLVKHISPNRHNRVPNTNYIDEVLMIDNLEYFTSSLLMLLNESDNIFDESVEALIEENERVSKLPINQASSIHGADEKIEKMRIIAEEFGLTGKHTPSISDLPFKLAEALGIKKTGGDGEERDWQSISNEICQDIEDGDAPRGGIHVATKN
jgi:hypothetical protein